MNPVQDADVFHTGHLGTEQAAVQGPRRVGRVPGRDKQVGGGGDAPQVCQGQLGLSVRAHIASEAEQL